MTYRISNGKILFSSVMTAINNLGGMIVNNEDQKKKCPIVWFDTLKEADDILSFNVKQWQIVNRLPGVNYLCRKAPLFRLLMRTNQRIPNIYNFFPKSYILPQEAQAFYKEKALKKKKYIYKPDNGSLGSGISIIKPNQTMRFTDAAAVVQEFCESALIEGRKFDLRVYVLVASIEPLRVYVYREGVARFCAEPNTSQSVYGQLTNTYINKQNPDNMTIEDITKTIAQTFSKLEGRCDTKKLWEKIDRIAVLTVISALKIMKNAESKFCPAFAFHRCFQILGFDILIDDNYEPKLLEVNYRPSLANGTKEETETKVSMITDVLKIMAPKAKHVQRIAKYDPKALEAFFSEMREKKVIISEAVSSGTAYGNFVCAYPTSNPLRMEEYETALRVVKNMNASIDPASRLPLYDSFKNDAAYEQILEKRRRAESVSKHSMSKSMNPPNPISHGSEAPQRLSYKNEALLTQIIPPKKTLTKKSTDTTYSSTERSMIIKGTQNGLYSIPTKLKASRGIGISASTASMHNAIKPKREISPPSPEMAFMETFEAQEIPKVRITNRRTPL